MSNTLSLTSSGYGLLLGALGAGVVTAAGKGAGRYGEHVSTQ